jgi:class 3 adenylate cyclase/CHASE2 domain-containing sensor protein
LCCPGFFVLFLAVKLKPVKSIPALIALGVIVLVCAVRLLRVDFFERLERMTYDMRVRQAFKFPSPVAANLGFVAIDESSIDFVRTNEVLGYRFGLYWPRQVYGRVVNELAAQGAKAVAFDVIFGELRLDHAPVQMADGTLAESDVFFAHQIQRASNVILAVTKDSRLPALFRTNALAVGDISIDKDSDGILRRAKAFRRKWHPLFERAQTEYGFDLDKARIESSRIVSWANGKEVEVPLDKDGNFAVADFVGDKIPPGLPPKAQPLIRVWNMGMVLAAQQLRLDLDHAEVDLKHGQITLPGEGGVKRVIPVDADGYFYIDWSLPPNHPLLTQEAIQGLLLQNSLRLAALSGTTNVSPSPLTNLWQGKLVVVGSMALGNDLTDRGATPLRSDTLLVSKHWNVANSIITGSFVRRAPLVVEFALIALLGVLAAFLTWELRVLPATSLTILVGIAYVTLSFLIYGQSRYWIPLVLPLAGALLMTHGSLLGWRVMFEQAQVRRIKSVFAKVVSPKIMKELLQAETLSLGGARREVSVLFSDVRGFTELTDMAQEQAAEFVRKYKLTGQAAETCFDEQAREILGTVNVYLGLAADIIIKRDGTLDKFIGDCVMAFWGAPTPNPKHAVACVRVAIESQRAIHALNVKRAAENQSSEMENKARVSAGLKPKPILPLLLLGTGINSGMATAGLMGSQAEQKNYTVFGREVNLASRFERLSGHGRVFIGENTYEHLVRDDPDLAATCILQPPQKIKGFGSAVKVYEVPWRPAAAPPPREISSSAIPQPAADGIAAGS